MECIINYYYLYFELFQINHFETIFNTEMIKKTYEKINYNLLINVLL